MDNQKILLATPIHFSKDYVMIEWLLMIKMLDGNYDILLVDNSPTETYSKKIRKFGFNVKYVNPKNDDFRTILVKCREIIRKYAVKNNYDYLFSLECDVFPKLNIINRLLLHRRDVVGGYYFSGTKENIFVVLQRIIGNVGQKFHKAKNQSIQDVFYMTDGKKLKSVYTAGLGCVLISSRVFKNIKFEIKGDIGYDDVHFAESLYHLRIPFLVDMSLRCRHENQERKKIIIK